jgi:4-amino-4-deoxy-L-arabinose transferase-like glycosyltransferase
MKRRDWIVLAGFLALALLLRFGTFFKSVIDFDESFFLLLGRSLLRGEIPYTVIWEHSPAGSFALFALIQAVFGQTVLAIRIATWLAAALEGFLLYRLGTAILGKRGVTIGMIAGTLYIFFTLINLGLAAHREMFLAPCVTFAIIMLVSGAPPRPRPARLLLAGLAMGFALQLKQMYVFECAAVYLIATGVVVSEHREQPREIILPLLKSYVLLAIGPILLFVLAGAYFSLNGHWADFIEANFRSAATYARGEPFLWPDFIRRLITQIRFNALIWLGVFLSPFYLAFVKDVDREERSALLIGLIWFVLAFLGTCSSKRFFEHYYLQLVAPASLITATVTVGVLRPIAEQGRARYALALTLILAGPLLTLGYPPLFDSAALVYRHYLRGQALPVDGPQAVSAYLQSRVKPDDYLYVADYEPIVNYWVDARIPTKYAFSIHLTDQVFAREGIDQLGELERIFAKRPLYVVRQSPPSRDFVNPPLEAELDGHLSQDYVLEHTVPANETFTGRAITVEIYRLRSPS